MEMTSSTASFPVNTSQHGPSLFVAITNSIRPRFDPLISYNCLPFLSAFSFLTNFKVTFTGSQPISVPSPFSS